MQKWEYLYVVSIGGTVVRINRETFRIPTMLDEINDDVSIFTFLDEFGQKGWEAVGFDVAKIEENGRGTIHMLLKRPIVSSQV